MPSPDSNVRHRVRCRLAIVIPLVLLFLSAAHHASAQCRVAGELRSADGAPIAGATVRIESPGLRAPVTATTDASGRYAIDDIKPGIWAEITAFHQNGRVLARAVTLVTQYLETVNLEALPESSSALSAADLDPLGGPSADIRGIVTATDGSPVAGATVAIAGTTLSTTTDSAGRYAFAKLRAGMGVELQVAAAGFSTAQAKAIVPGKGHEAVDIALKPAVAVEADAIELPGVVVAADGPSVRIRPDELAQLPTLDRRDVFRALQFLPSASAALEASSELFVRGGTPDQTGITFDGFTVYPLGHLWGTFSAMNMDAVEQADFTPLNLDASHGGRLAGSLALTGASGSKVRPGGAIDLSILGLATKVTLPLGSRGSLLLAGRHSPPSGLYGDLADYFYDTETDDARERDARFSGGPFGALAADPSFYDLNGKLRFEASPRDRLSFTLYSARDVSNRSHDIALPSNDGIGVPNPLALPADAAVQVSNLATWRGRGAAAGWEHQWSRSAATTLTVGRSEFSNDVDAASIVTSPSSGADYSFVAGRGGSQAVSEQNAIRDTTIRVVNSLSFGFGHVVTAGAEIVSLESTYGASTEVFEPTVSGSFTSTLVDLLRREEAARATTIFAQDAWRPFARLMITPGARVTRYDLAGTTYFDPRVNATYLVHPQFRVTGGLSIDHQLANRIVREDLAHGDSAFWTLADGSAIRVPQARQGFIGAVVQVPGLVWSVQGYYKRLFDLTMLAPRLAPGMAAAGSMLHRGTGRALGVETTLQHATDRNALWTSLTIGRTEYTYPTLQSDAFPAPFDRRFELKVTDTVRLGRAWSVGGVWVAAAGRPYTPASGAEAMWFPSGETLYRVGYDDKNSSRLPAYHRLDLSGQRDFNLAGLKATLGATVFNVYDRRNIAYTEHEVANAAVTSSDVMLMRRAVNVFVRFQF